MINGTEYDGMTKGWQGIVQNVSPRPRKEEESSWDLRKKRRKQWMELLKELDETRAAAKKMAKTEYVIRQSSRIVKDGAPDHELNEEAMAMQIFSALKVNVLLESIQNKKVKM